MRAHYGARGQAESAAEALAEASSPLSPPSTLGEVLTWTGVALGAVALVTGVGALVDGGSGRSRGCQRRSHLGRRVDGDGRSSHGFGR
jgi:hypothetical protein